MLRSQKKKTQPTNNSGGNSLPITQNPFKDENDNNSRRTYLLIFLIISILGLFIFFPPSKVSSMIVAQAPVSHDKVTTAQDGSIQKLSDNDYIISLETQLEQMRLKLESAEKEGQISRQSLQQITAELKQEKDKGEKVDGDTGALTDKIEHLQKEIQMMSKRDILETFGEGPYKVKMKLKFNDEDTQETKDNTFMLEMAPIDLMPHAVNHFLQMVHLGLLNGSVFHRNAGHVVQGGPGPRRSDFRKHNIGSVSFQEYSPKFPHVKYTIGYAGRPGGPDWYVSTIDNTRNHGPGGQKSYAVLNEADPCFGKVIDGFDAITRLQKEKVQPGGYKRMVKPVTIEYAILI